MTETIANAINKVKDTVDNIVNKVDDAINKGGNSAGKVKKLKYKTTSGLTLEAIPGKTTTIIGNYGEDLQYIIDELGNIKSTDFGSKKGGFNVLNVPDEEWARLGADGFWEKYNSKWLKEVIDRDDIIKVATKPTDSVKYWYDIDGVKHLTGFGKEIKMLEDVGYVYDGFSNSFVKS